MPRVSVIIPAFNAEQHIEETLRSVQSQTYDDWEIVLCDDGSTDRTVERARGVDGRVAIVQTETNLGPAVARNLAIERSNGELLAFLDADDYWLPAFLERQVSLYDADEAEQGSVGIVACNASLLDPDGLRPETHMEAVRFPSEVTLARLLRYNPIFVSVLVPRRTIDEVGRFSPDLSGTADYDLWIRIVEAGYRVIATREPLAVYRIGSPSLSSDARAMAHDMQRTYRRALERGNLPPRERRIARRELRRERLVEQIATAHGLSYVRALRALPLLLLVIAEHPRGWRSLPRLVARGRRALAPFSG
jgi:glycosyltransferase involved in cell wall biosynthesis